jgi:hypothetical protein
LQRACSPNFGAGSTERTAGSGKHLRVTRKRSTAKREARRPEAAEPPISGVAVGGLGTASNLDDTQVMRAAELERASAQAGVSAWLADETAASEPLEAPPRRRVSALQRVTATPRVRINLDRRTSAFAGAAAALILVLGGTALLGAVGNPMTAPALGQDASFDTFAPLADASFPPVATPTAETQKHGKGCNGKGHGPGCER